MQTNTVRYTVSQVHKQVLILSGTHKVCRLIQSGTQSVRYTDIRDTVRCTVRYKVRYTQSGTQTGTQSSMQSGTQSNAVR